MVELAVGMFALALVLSALFAFGDYIVRSLEMHRELRAQAGKNALNAFGDRSYSSAADSDTVEVEDFAAKYVFGDNRIRIEESVHMPAMAGLEGGGEEVAK